MEMNLEIPFQKLLSIVKTLSPSQKAKLRKELDDEISVVKDKDDFINLLLNGPVYSEEEIQVIQENRRSISEWRTKG